MHRHPRSPRRSDREDATPRAAGLRPPLSVARSLAVAVALAAAPGAALVPVPAAAQEGPPEGREEVLRGFADSLAADVEADGIGGIAAGLVVGDSLVWARGFGHADPREDRQVPMTAGTLSRTGSISKSFTAVLLLSLVEDGVVALDEPVARHVPELGNLPDRPPGADSITFRQLASHTAGLVREPGLEDAAEGPLEAWEAKILASIHTTPFRSQPGAEYSYSNIGVGILGHALARAAGRPFTTLVYERILERLGMIRTTFEVPLELRALLARGHANGEDGVVDTERPAVEHRGRGYKVPNGGVYSTVEDLARFVSGVTGASEPAILGPSSRRRLWTILTPGDDPRGYGLGFYVRKRPGGTRFVGHGGSVAGYTAHLVFEPRSRTGVILLRNYNRGETDLGEAAAAVLAAVVDAGNERSGR